MKRYVKSITNRVAVMGAMAGLLGIGLIAITPPAITYAAHVCAPGTPREGQSVPHDSATIADNFCGRAPLPPVDTADEEPRARANSTCNTIPVRAEDCPLLSDYVIPFINALSGAVGIVIVIMVAWGGLQYSTSRDNPQQSAQAKEHIRNALFALVFYVFIVAFLNWVVPGGVF